MPVNTSAFVVEILLRGVVLGQETINRFFYASTSYASAMIDVIDAFDAVVPAYLVTFMNEQAGFTSIEAQGVRGTSDFASKPISELGVGTGDCMPPFVSWDFTLVRGGARERNGYKRIAGVGEASSVGGIPTSSVLAVINAGVHTLSDTFEVGADTWVPVIPRTRVNRVPVLPRQYWDMSSAIFSKIGSQNSRKYGHGR